MRKTGWYSGCKVDIMPWIDGKRIYCNVAYYRPGQSMSQEPAWEKTIYITDDENGRRLAYDFTDTLVSFVSGLNVGDREITVTVGDSLLFRTP